MTAGYSKRTLLLLCAGVWLLASKAQAQDKSVLLKDALKRVTTLHRAELMYEMVTGLLRGTVLFAGGAHPGPAIQQTATDTLPPGKEGRTYQQGIDFRGDYETGETKQWHKTSMMANDWAFRAVTDTVRQGRYAGRFEVRAGDSPTTGERSEVLRDPAGDETPGSEYFYAWSTLFQQGWQQPCSYGIFLQFHAAGVKTSPSIAVRTEGDSLLVRALGGNGGVKGTEGYDDKKFLIAAGLHAGRWHDFVMQIHWSADSDGFIKVWHRNEGETSFRLAVNQTGVKTLQRADGIVRNGYLRQGLYRGHCNFTNVLYQDGMRRGNTLEAVMAGFR